MPKTRKCHFCEKRHGLILLTDDNVLCPRCYSNLYGAYKILPMQLKDRVSSPEFINLYDPIDKMMADLMATFISLGYTVSMVARQMGITRATIYARLKKYNLICFDDLGNSTLHLTAADVVNYGGKQLLNHIAKSIPGREVSSVETLSPIPERISV